MSHMLRFLTCRTNYQHLYHRGRVTHLCVGLSGSSKPVFSQIMAYCLIDAKLSSETMLTYCWLGPCEQILVKCYIKIQQFSYEEIHLENLSAKWRPFWSSLNVIPWTITQDVTYAAMLTHWGRDKMAAISQTMFSNAISWMKMCELRLKFHWSFFLGVQFWTNDG